MHAVFVLVRLPFRDIAAWHIAAWHLLLHWVAPEACFLSPGCFNEVTGLYQCAQATQASVPCAMQCIIKGTFRLVPAVLYVPSAIMLSTRRHETHCGPGHCLVMVWV